MKAMWLDLKASMFASRMVDRLKGRRPIHFIKYFRVWFREYFILKGDWDI